MKKLIIIMLCLMGSFLYAESYKIKNFAGNVTYKRVDKFETVTKDMSLDASTIVRIGLNSTVDIEYNDTSVTVSTRQIDTIENLYKTKTKKSLQKRSVVKANDVEIKEGRVGVATASTIASDAKEDLEWDE